MHSDPRAHTRFTAFGKGAQTIQHTVLLVDDEPNVLTGLRRALRKEPYTFLSASSVDEAFAILRAKPVQAVISDQDMPDMLGTEFIAKVRQEFPNTVCFILTGKAALHSVKHAIEAGTIGQFFTKPCNPVELSAAIRQTLQPKGLMTEVQRLPHNSASTG
jgi:DNA-binding NtrC family response regulator